MTRQEAFDKVWKHFIAENRFRTWGAGGGCFYYREETGYRCAIGILVPNARIVQEKVRGCAIGTVRGLVAADILPDFKEDIEYWADLQMAHDCAGTKDDFKGRLQGVAYRYDLTVPE